METEAQEFFRTDYLGKDDLRETGFGGTEEEWRYCRELILNAVDHDGTFLDLGCANGRLAADLQKWASEKGITLDVYGVDFVPELVTKAQVRMPDVANHFEVGDINTYSLPIDFDYIRTELIHLDPTHVAGTLSRYRSKIKPGGKLIVAKYDDDDGMDFQRFEEYLKGLGLDEFEIIKNEATCLAVFKN